MFKEPIYKSKEEYLREVQTDIVINWGSIHDEIDYLVLKSECGLHKAIMKRMRDLIESKDVINALGMKYLNFLFDVEWDDKGGSWIPDNSMDVYTYPGSREEKEFRDAYLKERGIVQEIQESEKESGVVEEQEVYEVRVESDEEFLSVCNRLGNTPDGSTKVILYHNNKKMTYKRSIDLSKY